MQHHCSSCLLFQGFCFHIEDVFVTPQTIRWLTGRGMITKQCAENMMDQDTALGAHGSPARIFAPACPSRNCSLDILNVEVLSAHPPKSSIKQQHLKTRILYLMSSALGPSKSFKASKGASIPLSLSKKQI